MRHASRGRDPEIARLLSSLFDLIEDDRFEEARAALSQLREKIGEGPETAEAEAYLWRMEHLGDEAAE